jgi:hypothetical protein
MVEVTPEQFWGAMRELAGTEPTVVVEPSHIKDWSVKRTLTGVPEVLPPDLERVTVTYDNGYHKISAVIYDRDKELPQWLNQPLLRNTI